MKKNNDKKAKIDNPADVSTEKKARSKTLSLDKRIKDLLNFINDTGLQEVYVETEEVTLKVKRTPNIKVDAFAKQYNPFNLDTISNSNNTTCKTSDDINTAHTNLPTICYEFKSPMIGTFYMSTNPETPPYVKEGDLVSKGQVLCIIEATKLFNEVAAEEEGKISKILINDASPVEYNQPLFLIEEL